MKHLLLLVLLFAGQRPFAQTDSCNLRISLITCGPGEELYSIFGHSALRVRELATNRDIIFNYGTFDFDDPNFYAKFTRGKLLYFVSTEKFSNFLYEYQYEQRSVTEQVLRLSCSDKQKIFAALRTNALEENKYYNYDFILDNCSTRLRDILAKNTEDPVTFNNFLETPPPTFRNLLYIYLDKGQQHWSKFGIDLLLGSKLDRKVSHIDAMFLPDFLMKGFDNATIQNLPLVEMRKTILPESRPQQVDATFFTPLTIFGAAALIIFAVSFLKVTRRQKFLAIFDISFFLLLGMLGFFLLFMWFGTDHVLTSANYNLLWALPTHLFIAFYIHSDKRWVKSYFAVNTLICLLLMIFWKFLPQEFNSAFFPLVAISGVRSFFRYKQ